MPPVRPGEVAAALPAAPPAGPESLDRVLDDYERLIEPNVTHWNHPGFLAYFAITGSGPGMIPSWRANSTAAAKMSFW